MSTVLLKIGKPEALPPEEKVLHTQEHFRAVSSKTSPSYRIGFDIPFLFRIKLIITDRRCRVLCRSFYWMYQDFVMWFPGKNPQDDPEIISTVSCQKGLFGQCLEIRTHNPKRVQRWLWSPDLTFRFFMKDPEKLEKIIKEQMGKN